MQKLLQSIGRAAAHGDDLVINHRSWGKGSFKSAVVRPNGKAQPVVYLWDSLTDQIVLLNDPEPIKWLVTNGYVVVATGAPKKDREMKARQNPPSLTSAEKAAIIRRAHAEAKAAHAQNPRIPYPDLFGEAMRRLHRAYAEGWLTEHCGATPADLAQLRAVSDGSYGYLQGKFRAAQRGRPDRLEARIDAAAGRLSADPEVQAVIRCGFPQPPVGQGRVRPAPIPVVEAPVKAKRTRTPKARPAAVEPMAAPIAPRKIRPREIILQGSESSVLKDGTVYTNYADLNRDLRHALNLKTHSGYIKTWIKIIFEDGLVHEARIDLGDLPQGTWDIVGETIKAGLMYSAGLAKPERITDQQYREHLDEIERSQRRRYPEDKDPTLWKDRAVKFWETYAFMEDPEDTHRVQEAMRNWREPAPEPVVEGIDPIVEAWLEKELASVAQMSDEEAQMPMSSADRERLRRDAELMSAQMVQRDAYQATGDSHRLAVRRAIADNAVRAAEAAYQETPPEVRPQATQIQEGNITRSGDPSARVLIKFAPGEGIIISGTRREDAEILKRDFNKHSGWRLQLKWAPSIKAWFVPHSRDWSAADSRGSYVHEIAQILSAGGLPTRAEEHRFLISFEDRAESVRERAEARSERLSAKAEKLQQESNEAYAKVRRIGDFIPMGQPILTDHYSARRHRSDIDKMDRGTRKSIELDKAAKETAERAEAAAYRAQGDDRRPRTIQNRINQIEAALRKIDRSVSGRVSDPTPEQLKARHRVDLRRAELLDELEYNRAALAKTGFGSLKEAALRLAVGQYVIAAGGLATITKINQKTVNVKYIRPDMIGFGKGVPLAAIEIPTQEQIDTLLARFKEKGY